MGDLIIGADINHHTSFHCIAAVNVAGDDKHGNHCDINLNASTRANYCPTVTSGAHEHEQLTRCARTTEATAQTCRMHMSQLFRRWTACGSQASAHLSHSRMQQSLWQNVTFTCPFALAHRWTAIRMLVAILRQTIYPLRWITAPSTHAYRRKTFPMPWMFQKVYAQRSSIEAYSYAHQTEKHCEYEKQYQLIYCYI